jgi:riboflavin-specific deaminase-like protein
MDRLRAEADAIVVGAGTMRADNPRLHVRDKEMRRYRRSLGKPDGLLRVLVTASAKIDARNRFFDLEDGGDLVVATVDSIGEARLAELRARAEVWTLGTDSVDPGLLLERLGDRGVERALLEGGGELNWRFFRDGLVDELFLTLAPTLLGGRDAPTPLEGEGFSMKAQRRLRLVDLRREGDELFCRYAVDNT